MTKKVDKKIEEIFPKWFSYTKIIENDSTATRVGVCVGSSLVRRPRKRWIDSMNN